MKEKKQGKILHKFEKPRSKTFCIMEEDTEDPWFVYVKKIENKSGKVSDSSMIIAKDVEDWIEALEKSGWAKKEQ
jgi:hypothetical protein